MKRSEIKKRKDDLMDLVKAFVKIRDRHTCQHCHKQGLSGHDCQASHVYPDGQSERLSYDPINIKVLCFRCHFWWHQNPTESAEWFRSAFPERMAYIEKHKNELVHWKLHDYLSIIEEYKHGNFALLVGDFAGQGATLDNPQNHQSKYQI